jgi:hypothetical protein
MSNTITWDRQMLDRFKIAYQQAVQSQRETFFFDGHEFLVGYAKYLIEYLEQSL